MALVKSIAFIDGENITMRYQALVEAGRVPRPDVVHVPDVFVWYPQIGRPVINTDIIRISYYTSMVGDSEAVNEMSERIASQWYHGHGDYYGACQLHHNRCDASFVHGCR
jgi:hypothetical protein